MLYAYIDDSGNLSGNRTYVLAAFCTTQKNAQKFSAIGAESFAITV